MNDDGLSSCTVTHPSDFVKEKIFHIFLLALHILYWLYMLSVKKITAKSFPNPYTSQRQDLSRHIYINSRALAQLFIALKLNVCQLEKTRHGHEKEEQPHGNGES